MTSGGDDGSAAPAGDDDEGRAGDGALSAPTNAAYGGSGGAVVSNSIIEIFDEADGAQNVLAPEAAAPQKDPWNMGDAAEGNSMDMKGEEVDPWNMSGATQAAATIMLTSTREEVQFTRGLAYSAVRPQQMIVQASIETAGMR